MVKPTLSCPAVLLASLIASGHAQGQTAAPAYPTPPPLSIDAAQVVATAALSACRADGYRVTVVIVDRGGEPRLVLRDDEAAPHTPESAERKAYTANSFDRPTAALGELATANPDFAWLGKLDRVIFVGGGLPIHVDGRLVGGLGVAGGIGPGTDERCAKAGLARLAAAQTEAAK